MIQTVHLPLLEKRGVTLDIKRIDTIHSEIPGNKYFKLKYNLEKARSLEKKTLLSFGGPFSNHIAALAQAGASFGFQTIGIIRGKEWETRKAGSPTLLRAEELGMKLQFISREQYRKKDEPHFLRSLRETYGDPYLLPEGGTNELAVKGCEEILDKEDLYYDIIACCTATGGTLAGLSNAAGPKQRLLGFAVLKGEFLPNAIRNFAREENWELQSDYHFGGYARVNDQLIGFINNFKKDTGIPLDPIYTGKMIYGLLDMVRRCNFEPGTRILAIHTGGLQGVQGMNNRLKMKKKPLIEL